MHVTNFCYMAVGMGVGLYMRWLICKYTVCCYSNYCTVSLIVGLGC